MKILLAINNLGTGGAESFLCRLARQLAENGHHIYLWQVFYPVRNHIFTNELAHENIHLFEFNQRKIQQMVNDEHSLKSKFYAWQLNRQIRKLGIQVVNSHLFEADCFVSKNVHLPQVISMHGSYEMYLNNPTTFKSDSIYRKFDFITIAKEVLSRSKSVITVTLKNHEVFAHTVIPLNVKDIYYGFNKTVDLAPQEEEVKVIGMLARGIHSKGWEIAIDACIEARTKITRPFQLKLGYTASEYMNELQNKYKELTWIQWQENVSNLEAYFSGIQLSLFPTQYPAESLPNVVIESLAFDIPILTTDIGEISKMISSNEGSAGIANNHLLKKEKLTTLFAEQICQCLEHQDVFASFRKNCSQAFEKFNINKTAAFYVVEYENALK